MKKLNYTDVLKLEWKAVFNRFKIIIEHSDRNFFANIKNDILLLPKIIISHTTISRIIS